MIALDSPQWRELEDAYGKASRIPDLLRSLEYLSSSTGNGEPWFSLWSALAHQGDVYSASFAAVPHIVRILATAPAEASFDYFAFPAWVEICRHRQQFQVPEELADDYFQSIKSLGTLVGAAAIHDWDANFLAAAMSALAVSKGFVQIGEAASELDDETSLAFIKLLETR